MVDPGFVPGLIGAGIAELLHRLILVTETAVRCREYCRSLHNLLKDLEPVVSDVVAQTGQPHDSTSTTFVSSTLKAWLEGLLNTLQEADGVVQECVGRRLLAPWPRYRTATNILKVMERIRDLLQQAPVVGIGVTQLALQATQRVETKMDGLQTNLKQMAVALATRDAIERGDEKDTQRAFQNVKIQVDNLRTCDDTNFTPAMSISGSSAWNLLPSPCTQEQIIPRFVFGLDERILEVREAITSRAFDVESHYIGIWGMGGAGKTVLAKKIHNDAIVRQYFNDDSVLWLTVGQTPSIDSLYASLRKQIGLSESTRYSDDASRTTLYNALRTRRVLLVLDDVWNHQTLEWLDIAKGAGSVTLLTTRKQGILQRLGASEVNISRLSDEDSWCLFSVYAFGGVGAAPSALEGVGKSVMGECKGLPLALRVVGSTMASKKSEGQWRLELIKLQNSRTLDEDMEVELFHRLKRSYDELSKVDVRCQECFLYFAAFPEDEPVFVKMLFEYWTGEGLVGRNGMDPIDDANCLLGVLIGMSLIELSDSGRCQIHDVLRDLALYIIEHDTPVEKRCALFSAGKRLKHFPREWAFGSKLLEAQIISLYDNYLRDVPKRFQAPRLTTLILTNNMISGDLPMSFLRGLPNLRVLDLSGNDLVTLPSSLGDLKNLRVVQLCYNSHLKHLPDSIIQLHLLEILDLRWCTSLKYLPRGLRGLTSLRRLELRSCNAIWAKSASSMTCLRQMTCYGLQRWSKILTLEDVCDLSSLTVLSLEGQNFFTMNPRIQESKNPRIQESLTTLPSQMSALVKMKKLMLQHFPNVGSLPEEMETLVELEELYIEDCGLLALPSWRTSSLQLSSLTLHWCPKPTCLSSFESLPHLRHLTIQYYHSIKLLPSSFGRECAFPSLVLLELSNCEGLLDLPTFEQGACPQLSSLDIHGWKQLKSLPPSLELLPNLKEIYLIDPYWSRSLRLPLSIVSGEVWVEGKSRSIIVPHVLEVAQREGRLRVITSEGQPWSR